MGLLDFLFGKTQKIEHDFFGQMKFTGSKVPAQTDYFECRRHFKPAEKIIEIIIDGDISGPTQTQVDFFKSIEDNYPAITKAIAPLIEDEFGNWKDGFKIGDFNKEFKPAHLNLPRCDSKPIIWEIVFESEHDRDHIFTLTMHDFEAKEIHIDG